MRLPVILGLMLGLAAARLHAAEGKLQVSKDPVKNEVTAVIESQLAAFRTNDYARAFTFAASSFKKTLALEQFQEMVKRGYPPIANSKSASFGICLDDGEQAVVNVTVNGADGHSVRYQYSLILEEGKWRINGVVQKAIAGEEV